MNRLFILYLLSFLAYGLNGSFVQAIDHSNLDEGRPLRVEDPYPIAYRELALEAGVGFSINRRSDDSFLSSVELLYGAYPNLQVGIGTNLSTEPDNEQAKFGDIELEALYNFNQETLRIPALAVKLEFTIPSGVDSPGISAKIKGLMTKSYGRLSTHINAGYQYLNGDRDGKRDNRLEFILGASYPVGAPQYTRLTIIGDVFTDLSVQRDDSSIVGTEFGFRYQLTQRTVWDAGVGTEFAGESERSLFYFTTGISVGF